MLIARGESLLGNGRSSLKSEGREERPVGLGFRGTVSTESDDRVDVFSRTRPGTCDSTVLVIWRLPAAMLLSATKPPKLFFDFGNQTPFPRYNDVIAQSKSASSASREFYLPPLNDGRSYENRCTFSGSLGACRKQSGDLCPVPPFQR